MKLNFGQKHEEGGLRPLSEREIREKLYGDFQETLAVKEEEPEADKKNRARFEKETFWPAKAPAFRFPWKTLGAAILKGLRSAGGLLRNLFGRIPPKWGLGGLVVLGLFLSIHALNQYRTSAMKKEAKPRLAAVISQVSKEEPAPAQDVAVDAPGLPLKGAEHEPEKPSEVPTVMEPSALPPAVQVPPDAVNKRYVIQVCTYAKEGDAARLVDQMKQEKMPAFFQTMTQSSGKVYHLVFLGRFETMEEAQKRLKEFKRQPLSENFPDSYIRIL